MPCSYHQPSPSDVWLFRKSRYEPEWLIPLFELVQNRPWKSAPVNGRTATSPIFDVFYEPVYTRDPQRNDVRVLKSAANEKLGSQRFCVINHHNTSFEMKTNNDDNGMMHNHRKTQHFIRGKIFGGSHDNSLMYGTKTFPDRVREGTMEKNKEEGFLYGTNAIKRFNKNNPATRPNNKLMLEEITDSQRAKHQKLAADKDNYLGRYYETKARQRSNIVSEKKKDFEMLRSYNPWGKPGGGAPRGYRNNEVDANVTKYVKKLKEENKDAGVGGGGSPNRTISGSVVTSLKTDPEIRFQVMKHNTDVDPALRYRPDRAYGKELDALVQESTNRKTLEKRKNLEEEIRQIECNPFGNQGVARIQKKAGTEQKSLSEGNVYDPWGKGYGGIPERNENGKILKKSQGLNDEPKAEHWVSYRTSCNDSFDKMQTRKKGTLMKNTNGQAFVRDFSPKESSYNPWGKPGAGAPMKDGQGNIVTTTTVNLLNGNMEGSAQFKRDPVRKKEYLKTLDKQRHDIEIFREKERSDNQRPDHVDVANWVRQGKVGRPNYDSQTKEIRANPKGTSDVTREKFQIRRLKNDNSKCYYEDLQEMADERNKRRQVEKTKQRKLSFEHVETMNNVWGRPGGGAPVLKQIPSFAKKHSGELLPTTKSIFR